MEKVFRHFQGDLDALKDRLLEMGGLAEERVRESVRGLMDRDLAALEGIKAIADERLTWKWTTGFKRWRCTSDADDCG